MATKIPTAFFSYCRSDSTFALRLAQDLRSAGANVWLDQLDIELGSPWDIAVEEALSLAPCLLVILSPVSVVSQNVRDEVSFALSKQKRVIPILAQECEVPFRLARLQHADFRADYVHGLETLIKALQNSPAPTSPPSNAIPPPVAEQASHLDVNQVPSEQAKHIGHRAADAKVASHNVEEPQTSEPKRLPTESAGVETEMSSVQANEILERERPKPRKAPAKKEIRKINEQLECVDSAIPQKPDVSRAPKKIGSEVVTPTRQRLGSVPLAGGVTRIVLRREAVCSLESLILETLVISQDNRRVGFVQPVSGLMGLRKRFVVVVDGNKSKEYEDVVNKLAFSPNGRQFGFLAKRGGSWFAALDGVEGPSFDDVAVLGLTWSPNSSRFAYCAMRKDFWLMVVDGNEDRLYNAISAGGPVFSPDSRRLAYGAKSGGKFRLNVDGSEVGMYDDILACKNGLLFSPDSQHFLCGVCRHDKWTVTIDGEEGPLYEGIAEGGIAVSPDSQRIAYTVSYGNKWAVLVDGEQIDLYDGTMKAGIVFSPDSLRCGFGVLRGSKWGVVLDGQELGFYEDLASHGICFSSDSQHYAYTTFADKNWMVVVDGEFCKPYAEVLDQQIVFSPDSRHYAYGAKDSIGWHVVVDGVPGRSYDGVFTPICFSSDSKHVIYLAESSSGVVLVVDDQEQRLLGPPAKGGDIVFDSPERFHFLEVHIAANKLSLVDAGIE